MVSGPMGNGMRAVRFSDIARGAKGAALLAFAAVMLAGCEVVSSFDRSSSPTDLQEALSEYRPVPVARAYINVPQALMVMERDLGDAIEQRVTLPNATSLAGENTIMLRAQTSGRGARSRLQLDEMMSQFGGPPTPFTILSDGGMTARSDAYGDITYTVLRPGGDLTCVLAFRRSQTGGRALPRGARALDMMMRNCVFGSVDEALRPLGDAAFGLGLPRSG